MDRIDMFGKSVNRFCTLIENIGVLAFVLMMAVTAVNVVGAKLFSNPLNGTIDIVMLLQVLAITFASGSTLLIGRHVAVEFFTSLLGPRLHRVISIIADLFGLSFFVVLVWRLFLLAHSFQTAGEVSGTVRIPLYPFTYLGAFACVSICLVYVHRIIVAIFRGTK
ncbi:MAG: hypothetical protein C0609_01835 [Deltaproteobacteria bacterium]|nr:MAG: hypothetical protein C0609_01835 [Deltaproteobacteria bacterium]